MKKFLLIVMLVSAMLFTGCSGRLSKETKIITAIVNNISDYRECLFSAKCEDYYIEYTQGFREESFIYNGTSEEKTDFGVFMIYFYMSTFVPSVNANITCNGEENLLTLEKSPYDANTYMVDIGYKLIKDFNNENNLVFSLNAEQNTEKGLIMQNKSKSFNIDDKKALNIGMKTFASELQDIRQIKNNMEFYLKILTNPEIETCFWAFSYITTDNQSGICIIDINSGEIISSNTTNK